MCASSLTQRERKSQERKSNVSLKMTTASQFSDEEGPGIFDSTLLTGTQVLRKGSSLLASHDPSFSKEHSRFGVHLIKKKKKSKERICQMDSGQYFSPHPLQAPDTHSTQWRGNGHKHDLICALLKWSNCRTSDYKNNTAEEIQI